MSEEMRHGAGREREELMSLEAEFGFTDGCTGELDAGAGTLERERASSKQRCSPRLDAGDTMWGRKAAATRSAWLKLVGWCCAWALGGKRNKQETERGGRTKSLN
jgi:hypothetical protein